MSISKDNSSEQVQAHSSKAVFIHWGFIAVFIYALAKQLDEVDELEDFALLEAEMIFASVFLILLVARFIYMRATRPTALPSNTSKSMMLMARSVHLAMYVSLSSIAVTGLMIGGLYWSGVKSGATMDISLLLHEIFVNTSYILIVGHAAAAIYHRRKGDGIWNSMVPFWKEPRNQQKQSAILDDQH